MSRYDDENQLIFENYISKRKQLNGETKTSEYQTYGAWKRAVKKLNPDAKFTGDKDIDSCSCKECEAEWDGAKGTIKKKNK